MTTTKALNITLVSAGAGSGKTHRLSEILHRELSGQARPGGVIATTFTNRAAAELRERARGYLLAQGDYTRANAIGAARIGTVNSVCHGLVQRFVFEAGLATEQRVIDEDQAAVLLARAIDTVLDDIAMAELLRLLRRLGLEDDWTDELRKLVKEVRANDIRPEQLAGFARTNATDLLAHIPRATPDDLTAQLLLAIEQAMPALSEAAASGTRKNTREYVDLVRAARADLRTGTFTWGAWVKLSKAAPEVALKPITEPIATLAGRVGEHPQLHADIALYLDRIFALCGESLAAYARTKRELGVLDFTDQEHLLLGLLDDPQAAAVLSDELDLLLVDEFQDTSPIQLALFMKLAGFAKSTYLVGDVKQAIYGFRGSDAELMRAVVTALPGIGGRKQVLGTSRRSRPELVGLVNEIYVEAFRETLSPDEVALQPARQDSLPGAPLANWILAGKNLGQEAAALARGIRQLVDTHYAVLDKGATEPRAVRHSDIAVLCRQNEDVLNVAAALRGAGIPCATAQPGLLATPEAVLALACLRRLNDSADTIATAEIVSLADCEEPEIWVRDRLMHLAQGGNADTWMEQATATRAAHPLLASIAALRGQLPVLAPLEALNAVITGCNLAGRVMRWSADAECARVRLVNLESVIALAAEYEGVCASGQHAASISGLIAWLEVVRTNEKDMLAEAGIDAVKVLTHHGAKGLEWQVVVLMGLASDVRDRLWSISAQSTGAFDATAPLAGRFIRYWPWPFGAQRSVNIADQIEQSATARSFRVAAIEEAKRLLYVSMTRARDLLVLARSSRKSGGEWIDSINAPWLLQAQGTTEITLPSGNCLRTERWDLQPPEPGWATEPDDAAPPLRWFPVPEAAALRDALYLSPSTTESAAVSGVTETARVGERITVSSGTDMRLLGNALHACLAMYFSNIGTPPEEASVERILRGFRIEAAVMPGEVLRQATALHDWVASRWPGARIHAEWPVQCVLDNGQVLAGRIDLLLDTPQGWILLDHKSNPGGEDRWETIAAEHAQQLFLYADAVQRASARPVIESWLYFPVAAGAVRVGRSSPLASL